MNTTRTKTLTAVIDGWSFEAGAVYGAIDAERVGVRQNGRSLTRTMDSRIVAEGYRRVGDWIKRGPIDYTATIVAHPQRCETCVNGCECEPGTAGCGHHGCWYATDANGHTCPGVAAVRLELVGGAA